MLSLIILMININSQWFIFNVLQKSIGNADGKKCKWKKFLKYIHILIENINVILVYKE